MYVLFLANIVEGERWLGIGIGLGLGLGLGLGSTPNPNTNQVGRPIEDK